MQVFALLGLALVAPPARLGGGGARPRHAPLARPVGSSRLAMVINVDGVRIGPPPDLPSLLLHNRIVYVGTGLVPQVAELIVAQLLYMQACAASMRARRPAVAQPAVARSRARARADLAGTACPSPPARAV